MFGAALDLSGDFEGAYVHDELGPLMEAALVARNEYGRVVPGRVYELHIVGRFLTPTAGEGGKRGVFPGGGPSQAVPVEVPCNRAALLDFSALGAWLTEVPGVPRGIAVAGQTRKGTRFFRPHIRRRDLFSSPLVFSSQTRYHEGHPPSVGPRGRQNQEGHPHYKVPSRGRLSLPTGPGTHHVRPPFP